MATNTTSTTPGSQLHPTTRFSNRVEYYVRSRPGYPAALLQFCADKLGLEPSDKIADVGSGTGILSALFLANGNVVFGIEPNGPMRSAAEGLLRDRPHFYSTTGTAEQTTLPDDSVKFVVAGQAFHWFDPPRARAEFQRILLPGGWVILAWNERKKGGSEFSDAYEKIIRQFEIDRTNEYRTSVMAKESKALEDFFSPGTFATSTFENQQFLDLAGVEGRALSSSYLPLPGQPRCQEMLDRLGEAFQKYQSDGHVRFGYETKVFYGRLS